VVDDFRQLRRSGDHQGGHRAGRQAGRPPAQRRLRSRRSTITSHGVAFAWI